MDKAMKTKFAIMLTVGVVLIFIILTNQIGSKRNPVFQDSFADTAFPNNSIINEKELDTAIQKTEKMKEEEDSETIEEPNFESEYASKHGDDAVEKGKGVAEKIVTLWLEENTDKSKWKTYSSSSFFNEIQKERLPPGDGVSRKVVELEMHAASPGSKEEMRFGVVATWNVIYNDSIIGKQSQLFYVAVVPYKNSWVVNKLVEPSEENHQSTKQ
ncbi:hypothetical protein [Lederbergia citrea]|uniref:hypothetical protein n=1 Tax=Lederbergia citrea TaxID=2833581 RepID=UPI001BC9A6C5|nr:hypothetical protein [Lederbergia citrea]MBS4203659.1 hypothetical protein [Lederbergia citrea]